MRRQVARFAPIAVGIALGLALAYSPGALRPLGPAAYALVAAVVFLLLLAFVALTISANLPADVTITPLAEDAATPELEELAAQYHRLGFASTGPPLEIGVWPPATLIGLVHEQGQTYGTVFRTGTVPGKTSFDFVSILHGERGGLTSSAEPLAFSLPAAPGAFRQALPYAPVEEVFRQHLRALAWLRSRGLPTRPVSAASLAGELRQSLADQRRHFRRNPLGFAAVALWRNITRTTPHLGPLEQQRIAQRQVAELLTGTRS